jgi:hypothetical protein
MANEVFISYSRRDLEFVSRLAADLDAKVAGVWFDKSDIRAGEQWRESIAKGIRDCKVMVLVLSPDSAASKNVQDEINQALEAGKTIMPVLYRSVELKGGLAELVHETQYVDLRHGSYEDNFQVLVDGLVAAGAVRQEVAQTPRPFLRGPAKTNWGAVVGKTPGWGCAWSLGWAAFWLILILALVLFTASSNNTSSSENIKAVIAITAGGGVGGFAGGLLAGMVTMLALRRYATSISWKHMSPAIRNWIISGPLGVLVSGGTTAVLVALGAITAGSSGTPDCTGLSFGDCLGRGIGSAIGEAIGFLIIVVLVFMLILLGIWFATGMFAAWLSVKRIRRLEPGITRREAGWVIFGWGLGSLVGAIASVASMGAIGAILGM